MKDPVSIGIAAKHHKTVPQVFIRWSLQRVRAPTFLPSANAASLTFLFQGFAPIPKSVSEERIKANADVFDFALSDDEVAELNSLDECTSRSVEELNQP